MGILILGLWVILSITIPIGLIFCASNSSSGISSWKAIGKLLFAFSSYLLICGITFIASLIIVLGSESKPASEIEMSAIRQLIGLTVIYLYGFIGYLLCSFINGKFLKPWNFSLFDSKKTQTIFNKQ